MRKYETLKDHDGFLTRGKIIHFSCDICTATIPIEDKPVNGGEFAYREGEVVKRYDLCLECAVKLENTITSLAESKAWVK